MSEQETLRRLIEANPYPGGVGLRSSSPSDAVISLIEERTRTMATKEDIRIPGEARKTPGRGPLIAAAAFVVVLLGVAVGLLVSAGDEPDGNDPAIDPPEETVATTVAADTEANPLPVVDQWVAAMNEGDLEGALAVLSPEASCDLPSGGIDACRDHLGYLIEIGTHFEESSCVESPTYRCNFDLTSELHATMGYPAYTLPMFPTFTLDEDGLLVADFFGNVPVTRPYIPLEAVDLWAYMQPKYPELNIGQPFGPDPYTAEAGVAVMEAAREINDPVRIVEGLQNILGVYAASGIDTCTTGDGNKPCSELLDFYEAIEAGLDLQCDTAAASEDEIPCVLTVDSAIHRALGSGATTEDVTVSYRGGRARGLALEVRFSTDPEVQETFVEFARTQPGLTLANNDRLRFSAETAPLWMAAAEEFAGAR